MSLLDKFEVVEIKVDTRISEEDKQFCERQQAAYTAAPNDKQHWTFTKCMEPVLLCAARFETGILNEYPAFFPSPPFDGTYGCNQMDFAGCEKLAQLRLFKNGRVDLRFTSEDYANQFIDTYLGRGYQESDGEAAG